MRKFRWQLANASDSSALYGDDTEVNENSLDGVFTEVLYSERIDLCVRKRSGNIALLNHAASGGDHFPVVFFGFCHGQLEMSMAIPRAFAGVLSGK